VSRPKLVNNDRLGRHEYNKKTRYVMLGDLGTRDNRGHPEENFLFRIEPLVKQSDHTVKCPSISDSRIFLLPELSPRTDSLLPQHE
jgi:hypothetical protein